MCKIKESLRDDCHKRASVMKHIISALVENKPGVLAHVAGMFAARAFNIDSLVVGRTEDPKLSRMTIVVVGDDRVVEQVRKQLEIGRAHV
jgi:acetolactate synthase I/III small subunit